MRNFALLATMEIILKETKGTCIKASVTKFEETNYLDIRKYYKKEADTEWKPTKQGISIPLDVDILKQLLKFIRRVVKIAKNQ